MSAPIPLTRCSPVQMRQALELVETMKQAGIGFVPIPFVDQADRQRLMTILSSRLDLMVKVAEETVKIDSSGA